MIGTSQALNVLKEKSADPNMLKDQPSLAIDGNAVDPSNAAISAGPLRVDTSNNASPSRMQSVYLGGYDNMIGRSGTCFPDTNVECLENGSHGICSDTSSHLFHGYSQMLQRSHAPFMPSPPSISGHGRFYDARGLPNSDPRYHQPLVSPNTSYVASQNLFCQTKLPVNIELPGDDNILGPRPSYMPPLGSFGDGSSFSRHSGGLKLLQQGFEGIENGELWANWSKSLDEKSSLAHFSSQAASPKQISSVGLSVNHCGMVSQQKELFYWLRSLQSSSYKYVPQGGRCNDFSCSCTIALDTLSERNRGPRAFKPRSQSTENASAVDNHQKAVADVHSESYNQPDFVTDYKDAKFFVIKSYSEDNVHKSIKYGVWASTPNGNKKLDSAYREAKEKHGTCPIFLLFSGTLKAENVNMINVLCAYPRADCWFSLLKLKQKIPEVNASAQFCGVAEMVGPVDFDKNVDFWQQDKWSGQFPVKWHIIKDVPNSQFRHIVLENNDNKPVTNSRDTQGVELELGVEMLGIFKNYESHSSILDDFHFYEERQKVMQVRKSRPQISMASTPVVGVGEQKPIPYSNDLIKKMSKSFAEAVLLKENERAHSRSQLLQEMMGAEPEKRS
ncbi:unnamed protein product [Dovyalis caffra]|uniref:YTH domain-containing family protein n=1 Tax=Dovyalis caffra TaxID=77055 RepID=A0AAV1RKT6_9ROSI|nr:unnamed protein product [Dovyalis caffra]